MKLTLYYTPVACSMVPYINLVEAGAQFEVNTLNMRGGQHNTPEYLRINPKHKVPTLVIDGEPLTENVAINYWIARRYPNARLLPAELAQEAKALALHAWFASGIHAALTPNNNPKRFCDMDGSEEHVKQCAQRLLEEHFGIANDLLAEREWFFDHYTTVDAHFFWCYLQANRLGLKYIDVTRFTHCMAHQKRMLERASVKQLLAFEKSEQERLAKAA